MTHSNIFHEYFFIYFSYFSENVYKICVYNKFYIIQMQQKWYDTQYIIYRRQTFYLYFISTELNIKYVVQTILQSRYYDCNFFSHFSMLHKTKIYYIYRVKICCVVFLFLIYMFFWLCNDFFFVIFGNKKEKNIPKRIDMIFFLFSSRINLALEYITLLLAETI